MAVRNFLVAFKVEQALAAIVRSETFQRALLMLHDAQIQVAGDANVKRACMAAENVDLAAGHSLVLGPRERPWRARPVRASVVEKLPAAWAQISILGVLRLRATSAVSRDRSVRRSAQDDDFVGGLKYSWLDMQKTRKDRKSHRLSG